MSALLPRVLTATVAGLLWLTACQTASVVPTADGVAARVVDPSPEVVGTILPTPELIGPPPGAPPYLHTPPAMPSSPNDDLSVGKEQFRQGNWGLAERHCRRATEAAPGDAAAWLCLAASYDRLKRFDLADRAYGQLIGLVGRTPATLNNLGYSYILRADYARAHKTLREAEAQDPGNPFIKNNLALLAQTAGTGYGVR
jgi:hypothetical protein